MTPEGPLRALSRAAARTLVERLARDAAPEAVAVVLLHSYAHPEHERLLGELIAERLPAVHVSLSHELVGHVPRVRARGEHGGRCGALAAAGRLPAAACARRPTRSACAAGGDAVLGRPDGRGAARRRTRR